MRIVIVGAGVLGIGAATALSKDEQFDVTLMDMRYPGSGSTGLSAGAFVRQYLERDELELRVAGEQRLTAIEREGGLNMRRIGFMRIIRDSVTMQLAEKSAAMQRELGVTDARVITPDELAQIVPHFNLDGVNGALWGPSDGYLDGSELCTTLAERAQEAGVSMRMRTKLTGFRRGGSARYVVETDRGELPADLVINTAGAWMGKVGDLLETPLKTINERHEAYIFRLPESVQYTFPVITDYMPSRTAEAGLYLRQEGEHQLIAGLHSNDITASEIVDPDDYYTGPTQSRTDEVFELLMRTFPTLDDLGYEGGWAGLYPHSIAAGPVLGPHPDNPDVIVGGGLGGQGLTVGLIFGEALAEWVRHGELRKWRSLSRFSPPTRTGEHSGR